LLNIIATLRDISKFRQAEEIKSTFVSVIGHELKTPVALIKGYVATLRRDDATWERAVVKDSLAVIEEEADHLTELIENLLDASRLQAGVLKINHADVSLPILATRVAERFRTQTQIHNLVVDFPDQFPIVLADEERLAQVLQNLISNAIKYSPAGGEIRISGQIRPDEVLVCVSDEGPGVAPEDIPYIFDRFYRSNLAARTSKGVGLGLYLTRAIIEAHRGRIWVDSQPGQGAHIYFSLPRS
jgi:signal transduction histidine kinase